MYLSFSYYLLMMIIMIHNLNCLDYASKNISYNYKLYLSIIIMYPPLLLLILNPNLISTSIYLLFSLIRNSMPHLKQAIVNLELMPPHKLLVKLQEFIICHIHDKTLMNVDEIYFFEMQFSFFSFFILDRQIFSCKLYVLSKE